MQGKMKAALMPGSEKPEIAGSALHYCKNGRIGDFVVRYSFVLSHEAGGAAAANTKGKVL